MSIDERCVRVRVLVSVPLVPSVTPVLRWSVRQSSISKSRPSKNSARSDQEQLHAAKFSFQSSARMGLEKSAASTRWDAMAAESHMAWPAKGSASFGGLDGSGRREPSVECARTNAHQENGEPLAAT